MLSAEVTFFVQVRDGFCAYSTQCVDVSGKTWHLVSTRFRSDTKVIHAQLKWYADCVDSDHQK
jgi:hypothetical protein